jgi:SAM-dependent methyltransferase
VTPPVQREGSASIEQPDYWWYAARSSLLEAALAPYVGSATRVLDVGSADGPSVSWMRGDHHHVSVDVDPRGLRPGRGVQASALTLPFRDASFDVVAAFDVIEHCDPEAQALAELRRVLRPGGRLLLSVSRA